LAKASEHFLVTNLVSSQNELKMKKSLTFHLKYPSLISLYLSNTHTHKHTHTHTHTHNLSLSVFLSTTQHFLKYLFLSLSLSLSYTHIRTPFLLLSYKCVHHFVILSLTLKGLFKYYVTERSF